MKNHKMKCCPVCGCATMKNVIPSDMKTPQGGELYVIEDFGIAKEWADFVDAYTCAHDHRFYIALDAEKLVGENDE